MRVYVRVCDTVNTSAGKIEFSERLESETETEIGKRQRGTDRQRDKQRKRGRERERDRQTDRQTEKERERERQTDRQTDRQTEEERERDRKTDRETLKDIGLKVSECCFFKRFCSCYVEAASASS